jgi:hypothetical protein
MQYDQYNMEEMEGKILLTHNKKFLYCLGFIGLYYITFLFFLVRVII